MDGSVAKKQVWTVERPDAVTVDQRTQEWEKPTLNRVLTNLNTPYKMWLGAALQIFDRIDAHEARVARKDPAQIEDAVGQAEVESRCIAPLVLIVSLERVTRASLDVNLVDAATLAVRLRIHLGACILWLTRNEVRVRNLMGLGPDLTLPREHGLIRASECAWFEHTFVVFIEAVDGQARPPPHIFVVVFVLGVVPQLVLDLPQLACKRPEALEAIFRQAVIAEGWRGAQVP
jgi:hypothetical protein